jgi:hypothetical protein
MKAVGAHLDRLLAGRIDPSRSLVVSGFWRSGTTWLQETLAGLLDAKTIFEPFHFSVGAARPLHEHHGVAERSESYRELFMPFARAGAMPAPLRFAFEQALRSAVPGSEVRFLRRDLRESLRRRVVVKCVRVPLCLHAAQAAFGMPVVHVRRDPRAVVASARLTDWAWLFDHLSLREQLLEPADGRAAVFEPWREEILSLDRDDVIERLTAYWALTEHALREAYGTAPPPAPACFVSYEELCRTPAESLPGLLARLGLPVEARDGAPAVDSRTTARSRRGASVEERIDGWKTVLTPDEARRIEGVVERLGVPAPL